MRMIRACKTIRVLNELPSETPDSKIYSLMEVKSGTEVLRDVLTMEVAPKQTTCSSRGGGGL